MIQTNSQSDRQNVMITCLKQGMLNSGILIWEWKLSIPSSPGRCSNAPCNSRPEQLSSYHSFNTTFNQHLLAIALFQARLPGTGDTK